VNSETRMSLVIPRTHYETMFRVLHAVSSAMGNTTGKSCVFFNVIGAMMAARHYAADARPVMGAAFIRVHDASNSVLAIGGLDGLQPTSSADAFHCWVEAGGHVIDFTAPTYREAVENPDISSKIPRKMFQKPLTSMAPSPDSLTKEGDFYLASNLDLTTYLLERFTAKPAPMDLAQICLAWFKKPPTKTPPGMSMRNDLGEVVHMRLPSIAVASSW
jgi:Protein of unknown function (DUF2026)